MRSVYSLLGLVLLACQCRAAVDTNICNPVNYPPFTGKLPVLPPQVSWRVELNVVNKGITWDIRNYIDYPGNRYSESQWVNGTHYINIIKYASDELITIQYPADGSATGATCQISQASTSNWAKATGAISMNGSLHIPKPLGVLRMDAKMPIKQLAPTRIQDGINVNAWEGCLYDPSTSTTNLITWYFADATKWYYAMGPIAAPIRMSVIGTSTGGVANAPLYNFHHEYNFADYKAYLNQGDIDTFKVPEGIFCQGDKTSMPMPPIPSHFSLRSEIVDRKKKYVNWIAEFYDNQLNLTRYDYQPNGAYSQFGNRRLTRVHDFNDGIAYIMDPEIGNCTITSIQKYGYDDKGIGMNVRIRTPAEFFDVGSHKYIYVGQRVERGVACDVWVTQRTDWPPPGPSYPTTWEYYFSRMSESVGTTNPYSVPVKLHIVAANPSIDTEYNFYQFDSDRSSFHDYNIGQCFNSSTRADYTLVIPGNHRFLVWSNLVIFKRLLTLSVSSVALVSPLRVTNIQTSFNTSGLVVSFSLLDKPPIQGDVQNNIVQASLDQAVANLKPSLDAKNFTILVSDPAIPGGFQNLIPNAYAISRGPKLGPGGRMRRSIRDKRDTQAQITKIKFQNKDDTGLTSGALAGLAVGLLIAGIVVGLLVFIVVDKLREGGGSGPTSITNPGYDN